MIDTIRFQIPTLTSLDKEMIAKSHETVKFSHATHEVYYRIFTTTINLGSYNRDINFFQGKDGFWYLELSLPKYINGHNVYLLYDYRHALRLLHAELCRKISQNFPPIEKWNVQRVDLCYAWKYEDQEKAVQAIRSLHTLDYDRKSKTIIDDNIMFKGSSYSIKFYLKHPEVFKHDYKILKLQGNQELAERVLNVSQGVLRFEITMRKDALVNHFERNVNINDITTEFIFNRFDFYLNKLMGISNTSNYLQNRKKLIMMYGSTKAGHLLLFLNFYQTHGKKEIKSFFDRATIYRNIKLLKKANISLVDLSGSQIELRIPSPQVVNFQDN